MKKKVVYGVVLLLTLISLPWFLSDFTRDEEDAATLFSHANSSYLSEYPAKQFINEPLQPVVEPQNLNSEKISLGRRLFSDKRLSPGGDIACSSCHRLDDGGADRRLHPVKGDKSLGMINTLSVYNSANNFRWYWDGRATTLEAQVDESVTSLTELGARWNQLLPTLVSIPEYQAAFTRLYPSSGIQKDNVIDVIVEFERSLVTPGARFDRFLLGEVDALTSEEKNGYQLFKTYGCIACHQGGNVGGNMFQLFGVMANYFAGRKPLVEADQGRFNVTGNEDDRYRFRVPSLRNVALTAPYFHDGTVETLEQAVMVMASHQLGRPIPPDDARLIVLFLRSLSVQNSGDL